MSFDRLARHYSWMERLLAGEKLQRCRLTHVQALRQSQRILLVGEGHGRFLEAAVEQLPAARFTYLDASEEMLQVAHNRLLQARLPLAQIQFVRANILDWSPPPAVFDAIVSNFFLDCFPPSPLEYIVTKLAAAATAQALWLLSDFCVGPGRWAKMRAECILWLMYRFFRLATDLPASRLTPPDTCLTSNGFRLAKRVHYEWGLLHADLWARDFSAPISELGKTSPRSPSRMKN
jgi:SAM-dependent methyltransferase